MANLRKADADSVAVEHILWAREHGIGPEIIARAFGIEPGPDFGWDDAAHLIAFKYHGLTGFIFWADVVREGKSHAVV